jgi:hypothetical protein
MLLKEGDQQVCDKMFQLPGETGNLPAGIDMIVMREGGVANHFFACETHVNIFITSSTPCFVLITLALLTSLAILWTSAVSLASSVNSRVGFSQTKQKCCFCRRGKS